MILLLLLLLELEAWNEQPRRNLTWCLLRKTKVNRSRMPRWPASKGKRMVSPEIRFREDKTIIDEKKPTCWNPAVSANVVRHPMKPRQGQLMTIVTQPKLWCTHGCFLSPVMMLATTVAYAGRIRSEDLLPPTSRWLLRWQLMAAESMQWLRTGGSAVPAYGLKVLRKKNSDGGCNSCSPYDKEVEQSCMIKHDGSWIANINPWWPPA